MPLPDTDRLTPVTLPDGSSHPGTVLLEQAIDHPNITVGAYSYASDFDPPQNWAQHLAPYLFPGSAERLIIGSFCQIAHGVRFITASANHATGGLTCYPFQIFDLANNPGFQPDRRDTIIGHDVWIGYGAMVLPGAEIGNGAIIGAHAVVRGKVPPYAIVTGNPGAVQKYRFAPSDIARLLALAWWHWPKALLEQAEAALIAGDLDTLEALAP